MKKVYTKPTIAIESFALNQSVAVSCGYTDDKFVGFPTQTDKENCGWNDGWSGAVYWHTGVGSNCTQETDDNAVIGEVCYNEPNGAPMIFAS